MTIIDPIMEKEEDPMVKGYISYIEKKEQFREALRGSSFEQHSDFFYDLIIEIKCRYFLYAEYHDLSDKSMLPNEERMKTNFVTYNYVECLKKELEICDALDILLKDKGKCVVRGLTNKTNIAEDSIIPLLKRRFYEREILTEYEKTNNISLGKEPTIENIAITKKHIENSIRKNTKRGAKEKNYILKDAILPFLLLKHKGLKNNDYRAIYNALDIMGLIDLSLKEQWRKTNSYQPEIAFAKSVVKELLKTHLFHEEELQELPDNGRKMSDELRDYLFAMILHPKEMPF